MTHRSARRRPRRPTEKQLERVTIRFAGDSGDGMQLTGTQFTRTAAAFGNDISTFPDFPAEIRAPAGSLPGVSGFQLSFSSTEIHTPGDAPDVLVAMNPAALKANLGELPAGGALIVNEDAFTPQNLHEGRLREQPADRRLAQAVERLQRPDLDAQQPRPRGPRPDEQAGRPDEELLRPRAHVLAVRARPWPATIAWIDDKFSKRPEIAEGNKRALKAGYNFGETTEIFHERYIVPPAKLAPGPLPEHHRQRGDRARLRRRVAARRARPVLRLLPDHAGLGHPPPARGLQELRRQDVPGRGRDRGHRRGDRRELRRRDGHDRLVRPGHRAQERGARARGHGRAAARRRRRPARRPVDGHADQDRAGGPAPGHVRAQLATRRVAGRRAGDARASASTFSIEAWRLALKYMTPVVYMSDAFLATGAEPWHIPNVDDLPSIAVPEPHRARGLLPVPARRDDARPAVGGARHARPRAPHRRPREGRHPGQRQLRPGQPPPDAAAPPGQDRGHRRGHPAARGLRPGRGRPARPRLGLDVRRDPERGRAAPGARRVGRPRPPALPEPVPGEHRRRRARPTSAC